MDAATDPEKWAVADLGFHQAVLEGTGNELMASLFSVVESALGMFFVSKVRTADKFNLQLPHHLKVFEAIRRKQPEVARQAMHDIIMNSVAYLPKKRRSAIRKMP